MFILAGSALLGHSVRLNDLDRILKLLVKIIILSISISRYPLLNGENFKTCSFFRQKKKQKISLNDNMMKLSQYLLLAAFGKTFARPFGARRNLERKKKKCIYETGFHSDLLIHEKLRSEIIVKADFKSAIIIEKKKLLLINRKRKQSSNIWP